MYKSKIVTREDGTQYVMCTLVCKNVVESTKNQSRMYNAIKEFGTSA